MFNDILYSASIYKKTVNLFQLGSCFSDSATHVASLCFTAKKVLFSLLYMIPVDLELTVVKGRRMWNY